ncbi:MAG TPA: tripartite tricarboxylate transporter permease, partial [Rhizobium sp.]|nr:tripartite tricarboxylate transporter permease [Rhizobium sp.]
LTFDIPELIKGVSFLIAVMGLFGIGELLLTTEEGLRFDGIKARVKLSEVGRTLVEMPRYWFTIARSTLIGIWMGITPAGPTAASFMSYGVARRSASDKSLFGKGDPRGIVAPETADHSAGTSALLPMLALGVPGSATAAVMMGGLMIWGLTPGPTLFTDRPDFVWGLIASMYLGNIVAVILVIATVPLYASILRVPFAIIGPIIVAVIFSGAYQVANAVSDMWLVLLFGLVGYVFKKLDYPLAPLVLAMVLGDKAEDAFRQSMLLSDSKLSVFWSNGLVTTLMLVALAMLFSPLVFWLFGISRRRRLGVATQDHDRTPAA